MKQNNTNHTKTKQGALAPPGSEPISRHSVGRGGQVPSPRAPRASWQVALGPGRKAEAPGPVFRVLPQGDPPWLPPSVPPEHRTLASGRNPVPCKFQALYLRRQHSRPSATALSILTPPSQAVLPLGLLDTPIPSFPAISSQGSPLRALSSLPRATRRGQGWWEEQYRAWSLQLPGPSPHRVAVPSPQSILLAPSWPLLAALL